MVNGAQYYPKLANKHYRVSEQIFNVIFGFLMQFYTQEQLLRRFEEKKFFQNFGNFVQDGNFQNLWKKFFLQIVSKLAPGGRIA